MGNCSKFNPKDQVQNVRKLQPLSLFIKHYTWTRDSHGLFDYENNDLIKGQFKSNQSQIKLFRTKNEIKMLSIKEPLPDQDCLELISLNKQKMNYLLTNKSDPTGLSDNSPWIVVKSLKTQNDFVGYKMKEGDYIKLGRVRFRIREIKIKDETDHYLSLNRMISISNLKEITLEQQEIEEDTLSRMSSNLPMCRICLGEEEKDNPLITPCLCQGSVKFIHINCLQKWLNNKLNPKLTKFSVSFVWKKFECELCRSEFPNVIKRQGKSYETVEIPKPQAPYITLEILSKEQNQSKGTHIISLAQKQQIKLGRGHDSDVRITDISVSRFHAVIKFINGNIEIYFEFVKEDFYLEDNKSKFGTLVLLKERQNISCEQNNNLAIQLGRSVVSFEVKKEWAGGSCCFRYIYQYKFNIQLSGQLADDPGADEVSRIEESNEEYHQARSILHQPQQPHDDQEIIDEEDQDQLFNDQPENQQFIS